MTNKTILVLLICLCLLSACQQTVPEPASKETAVLTSAPQATARSNGTLQDFKAATLKAIIQEFKDEVEQVSLGNQSLYPYPSYQVRVNYEGRCREIQPGRLQLMALWASHFNPQNAEELLAFYEMECSFSEQGQTYWMPIQKVVLEALKVEVNEGDEIDLYIRWIGINREETSIDWVFWIIDFLEV